MNWSLLRPLLFFRSRWLASAYLAVACVNALTEVLSVAAIYPMMAVASQPDKVLDNPWMRHLHQTLGSPDSHSFLVLLAALFLGSFVLTNVLNALTYWLHLRFTLSLRHALSVHLLKVYLHRCYAWFSSQHTSDLVKNVIEETDRLVYSLISKLSTMLYRGITALCIVGTLVLLNPWVALSCVLLLSLTYRQIYTRFRVQLESLGSRRWKLNHQRYRLVQESLSAIKEGRLVYRRGSLHAEFEQISHQYAAMESRHRLIGEMPRHLTEALAVLALLLVFFFYDAHFHDARQAFPWMGLYVMATWRLVPALQEIYACMVDVRFSLPVLQAFQEAWCDRPAEGAPAARPRSVQASIRLENVSYTYAGGERPALHEVTLEVPKSSWVALVGHTGSGKTTTADLLGGLLLPDSGRLCVDEVSLEGPQLLDWQASVGYVPQTIYLSDQTIAHNIALGYPENEINLEDVRRAARIAQIDKRIELLPEGYQTLVGERGLTLSGGERQRIGIARALYHRPEVLILDEATSALDQRTESSLMEAVEALAEGHTLILIAHRLSSVKGCSRIFVFEEGRLVSQGTYEQLQASCPVFRGLAGSPSASE